jgi:PPK2 family polyphosphate:nucleotide phosphotransferase
LSGQPPVGRDLADRLRVKPGGRVRLARRPPDETFGHAKEDAAETLEKGLLRLDDLQERLFASKSGALLVILQGMDSSGKDGTITHVMHAFNAQGVEVTAFGVPSPEEHLHDFLWRHHKASPRRGMVGIHNRSHYESVLVERVAGLTSPRTWRQRYEQINAFEHELTAEGTRVVKFFLHIDADEQRARFEARLKDPTKEWKFSLGDLDVRRQWDAYTRAYEDALSRCSTEESPWYVVPANRKWFRNLCVAEVLVTVMEGMHLRYPDRRAELADVVID